MKQQQTFYKHGFTLIELLIVVAIIAILAAIAVPNFLEAQTRAKVSRVASDLRTYDTAVETYRIDHNKTPPTRRTGTKTRTWMSHYLTTPISYINTALPDPFNQVDEKADNRVIVAWGPDHIYNNDAGKYNDAMALSRGPWFVNYPTYSDGTRLTRPGMFFMFSMGPDRQFDINHAVVGGPLAYPSPITTYDATNGTISRGDINRFNG